MGLRSSAPVRSPSESKELSTTKILVLGPADAGKSTVLKQVARCYGEVDRSAWVRKIHGNVITFMQMLIASEYCGPFEALEQIQVVRELTEEDIVERSNADVFKAVWADPGVQLGFQNAEKFNFRRELAYFLLEIDRIASPNYLPSDSDIIRCRDFSGGINDYWFQNSHGGDFRVIDIVGPKKGKWKKYLHSFSGVEAVLFVISLADYNLPSRENPEDSYMGEALRYCEEVSHAPFFSRNVPFIFFFNKEDVFREKIATIPLSVCPELRTYVTNDYDTAIESIRREFEARVPATQAYCQVTCLTDTHGFERIFETVTHVIIHRLLERDGLL